MLKMKKLLFGTLLLLLFSSTQTQAQAPLPRDAGVDVADQLAQTITADQMMRHLSILAADDMEGRETGQPGQKKAADYIAGYFAHLGLPPIGENKGYFQTIAFLAEKWETIELQLGNNKFFAYGIYT